MDKTTHYGYNKPSELEYIDTDDYNENFDLIDGQIKELYDLKVDAVTNYDKLTNRPSIEGVMLTGDVTFEELGISEITEEEIEKIIEEIRGL